MRHPKVRLFVLLLISFVEAMNIFITYPVMPRLVGEIGHLDITGAALVAGWMLTAFATAQFFLSPICGMLSDAFGRRPVLLLSLLAYALNYACMSLAQSIPWLFFGRILSGGVGATSVVLNASMADITDPDQRAARFGLISAAYGSGYIVGPALGGMLAPLGLRAPFVAAAVLAACAAMVSLLLLPETLPRERRKPVSLRQIHVFSALTDAFRRMELRPFLLAIFLFELGYSVYPSLWAYYLIQRFNWSAMTIGLATALTGAVLMLGQSFVLGRLVKNVGERKAVVVGAVATILEFVGCAFANASWMIFALSMLDLVCFMTVPVLIALVSARTHSDEQGYVQGVIAALSGLTLIIGPVLNTHIFAWSTESVHFPFASGIAFLVAAGYCAMGLFVLQRWPAVVKAA
jgi:DHA1 family tetracycline resistance protein-like MFS transporter